MTRAADLPASLGDAFTVAQAQAAGVGPAILRRLPAPHRGVRCRQAPRSLGDSARALTLVLPRDAAMSHSTAAELLGLWLPTSALTSPRLEVLVPAGTRPTRLPSVIGHEGRADVVELGGLRVCCPPAVFAQLAPRLSLLALATLADSVIRWRSPWSAASLEESLSPGGRGVRKARAALRLARPGSNSARESLVRLWLCDAGLPEPELNGAVLVGDRTEYVDLLWRDRRVGVEYHGGYHFASDEQRLRDLDRVARLRQHGWTIVEATRLDLASPARRNAVIDDVARALGVRPVPHDERGQTLRWPPS